MFELIEYLGLEMFENNCNQKNDCLYYKIDILVRKPDGEINKKNLTI